MLFRVATSCVHSESNVRIHAFGPKVYYSEHVTRIFFQKVFEGELLIRIQPTGLLQILCEVMVDFEIVMRNTIDPNIICHGLHA